MNRILGFYTWQDALFFCGCVLGSFALGWCWSLAEHFMRVDVHV